MDEFEEAVSVTGLTGNDKGHVISDDDKMLVQHAIELVKVVRSCDVTDHVIPSYLFRCVPSV